MMAKDKGLAVAGTAAPLPAALDHEWSAEEELQLFHAMEGLRPVGINKHFYMSCIVQRLSKSLNREMPSELIWRHLGTMYKLKELDDLESLPFPNEEREFSLPEQDYGTLQTKKTVEVHANEEAAEAQSAPPTAETNGKGSSLVIIRIHSLVMLFYSSTCNQNAGTDEFHQGRRQKARRQAPGAAAQASGQAHTRLHVQRVHQPLHYAAAGAEQQAPSHIGDPRPKLTIVDPF